MKSKNEELENKLTLKSDHPLYHSLDILKIGHGILTSVMSKSSPLGTTIAITNDAILNIIISSTAQEKTLGKSIVEFVGGFGAGTVCTISTGGNIYAGAFCSYIGGEVTSYFYDSISQANGYNKTEDYIQKYYNHNSEITFEDVMSRYKLLDKLKEGDYAHVNSPFVGSQLYTKVDGALQPVIGTLQPIESNFIETLRVENSSLHLKTTDTDIKIDSIATGKSVVSDYYTRITNSDTGYTENFVYSNLSTENFAKNYNVPLDKFNLQTQPFQSISSHSNVYTIEPNLQLLQNIAHPFKFHEGKEEGFEKSFSHLTISKINVSTIDYSKFTNLELVPKEELSPRAKWLLDSKLNKLKLGFSFLLEKYRKDIKPKIQKSQLESATIEQTIKDVQAEINDKKQSVRKQKQKEMDDFIVQTQKEAIVQNAAIKEKGQQEMDDFIAQTKKTFDVKISNLQKKGQQEMDSFTEQKQSELNSLVNALRQGNPKADCSGILSQKSAEIQSFQSKKNQEISQQSINLENQVNAEIEDIRAKKEKEVQEECKNSEIMANKKVGSFRAQKQKEVDQEFSKIDTLLDKEIQERLSLEENKLKASLQKEPQKIKAFENMIDKMSNDQELFSKLKESIKQGVDANFIDYEIETFLHGVESEFFS